jgi:hypothetical protein
MFIPYLLKKLTAYIIAALIQLFDQMLNEALKIDLCLLKTMPHQLETPVHIR